MERSTLSRVATIQPKERKTNESGIRLLVKTSFWTGNPSKTPMARGKWSIHPECDAKEQKQRAQKKTKKTSTGQFRQGVNPFGHSTGLFPQNRTHFFSYCLSLHLLPSFLLLWSLVDQVLTVATHRIVAHCLLLKQKSPASRRRAVARLTAQAWRYSTPRRPSAGRSSRYSVVL